MTKIAATGFNTGSPDGDLSVLDRTLARHAELGATGAEITCLGLNAVIANRVIAARAAEVRAIMDRFALNYSMHAPIAVNLMDAAHAEIMSAAAGAALELAAEIGARVVVLHPGRVPPQDWVDRQASLLQFELDRLGPLADRAEALGLQIAYENISPNPRVIAGQETSYSLDPAALAAQLARLDHPAVMACLDISHAQQGAGLWGFDMVAACQALAPWIGHIHYSDSTGMPATFPVTELEKAWFGVGDMHAPPGHGRVDYTALAAALSVRQGTRIVIEIKKPYHSHAAAETLAAAQGFGRMLDRGTAAD